MVTRTFIALVTLAFLTVSGCTFIPDVLDGQASGDVISDGAMMCEYDPYGTLICKG